MQFSVIFTRPKKWNPWSWAISAIERCDFSHVCISYDSHDFGGRMVVQSKLFNVHQLPLAAFSHDSEFHSVFSFNVDSERFERAMGEISDDVGSGYAYYQLPYLAMMRIFKVQSRFDDPGMTCSELVAKFLLSGIVDEESKTPFCDYGLREVFDLASRHAHSRIINTKGGLKLC
jgi:hypothetical protein